MRRSHRRLVRALAAIGLAASGPVRVAADDAVLVESGERSFLRHCSACHGLEGKGDGPVAPVLIKPPADLTRIAARRGGEFPDAAIADFIDGRTDVAAHGSREMPVWGRVFSRPIAEGTTGEEVVRGQLWILVEYLKSIQSTGGAPGVAGEAPEQAPAEAPQGATP
jgi:mono/diheme cytochrome c family protein